MAGIRHGMWGQFPTGKSEFNTEEEWYKDMIVNRQVNCKMCGGVILQASQDQHGKGVDWAWEMQNEVHGHCYTDYMHKLRNDKRGPESR